MKQKVGPFLSRTILVLGSLVFTIGLVEIGLRILNMPFTAPLYQPCVYIEDSELGFRYKPESSDRVSRNYEIENIAYINTLGFHDVEHDLTDEQQIRVLALGDSFTAALYLPHEASWPQVSEKRLGAEQFEFFNLGIDGSGTEIHLALLEEYAPQLKPEIVVLAFYVNDFEDTNNQRFRECYQGNVLVYEAIGQRARLREFIDQESPGPIGAWLGRHSHLYRIIAPLFPGGIIIKTNYISPTRAGLSIIEEPPKDITADRWLNQFIDLAATYEFQFLIVPIPHAKDANRGRNTIEMAVEAETFVQLQIADIAPQIEARLAKDGTAYEDMYWQLDGHLNAYGTAVYAEVVADYIQEHLP